MDSYTYDVFGAIRSQSGSSDNCWLFTGEQRDADSDMYHLRARYYDPETGRFLSQDPARAGHLYAYARNNPVRFTDPLGLRAWEGGNWDQIPWWVGIGAPIALAEPTPFGEVILTGGTLCYLYCEDIVSGIEKAWGTLFSASDEGDETEVTFGHGSRHLEGTGLSQEEVEDAIEGQIQDVANKIPTGESVKGRVKVGDTIIEWRGYKVSDGRIHVGTYVIPR